TRMAKTGEAYAAARAHLVGGRGAGAAVQDSVELPAAAQRSAQHTVQTLHVTNGDSAAGSIHEADPTRRVLPWRDVLHAGPIPDVPDGELRRVRAAFLTGGDSTGSDIGQPDDQG